MQVRDTNVMALSLVPVLWLWLSISWRHLKPRALSKSSKTSSTGSVINTHALVTCFGCNAPSVGVEMDLEELGCHHESGASFSRKGQLSQHSVRLGRDDGSIRLMAVWFEAFPPPNGMGILLIQLIELNRTYKVNRRIFTRIEWSAPKGKCNHHESRYGNGWMRAWFAGYRLRSTVSSPQVHKLGKDLIVSII